MKVYKFGGASVRNADGVRNLARVVEGEKELFIIVSAMGKTTNALERVFDAYRTGRTEDARENLAEIRSMHQAIIDDLFRMDGYRIPQVDDLFSELDRYILSTRFDGSSAEMHYDHIVSYGELVSTIIVSSFLNHTGMENTWIDMRRTLLTQNRHKDANVLIEDSAPLLRAEVARSERRVFVGQGFIGRTSDGTTTTLGREGSDYSAAIVANILGAESMTVWKDVDGIMNADPKLFPDARKIDRLNYVDTIELAYSGAQVIHPKTIKPLQNRQIPLFVKPFGNRDASGTAISDTAPAVSVPIIIRKNDQVLLTLGSKDLSFVLEEKFPIVFHTLERFRVKTNLIHNTAVHLALCVESSWHMEEVGKALEAEGFDVRVEHDVELLTIRHYDDASYRKYVRMEECLVMQVTPTTIRVVRRPTR